MVKKVTIGNATLYHGDAIEIMRDVLPESADLCVTDPPYRLTSGGRGTSWSIGDYKNSGELVDCDIDWPDFMYLIYKSLRGDSHAYVMANNRHVEAMLFNARQAGFGFHNLLVWDKRSATPNRWYMKNLEFIGFFYKGKAKYINDMRAKQLIAMPQIDESNHPTEKPVALMQYYIEQSSEPNQTVLDPFMGSGTTGVAAIKSSRKFIGIESNKRWFDVACERISKTTAPYRTFI